MRPNLPKSDSDEDEGNDNPSFVSNIEAKKYLIK